MSSTSQDGAPGRRSAWLWWAIGGGVVGWLLGFFALFIHIWTHVPEGIPMQAGGGSFGPTGGSALVGEKEVTAYVKVYGRSIHEETGPLRVVFPSCDRLAGSIAWSALFASIVVGAIAGVWLRWVVAGRPHPAGLAERAAP